MWGSDDALHMAAPDARYQLPATPNAWTSEGSNPWADEELHPEPGGISAVPTHLPSQIPGADPTRAERMYTSSQWNLTHSLPWIGVAATAAVGLGAAWMVVLAVAILSGCVVAAFGAAMFAAGMLIATVMTGAAMLLIVAFPLGTYFLYRQLWHLMAWMLHLLWFSCWPLLTTVGWPVSALEHARGWAVHTATATTRQSFLLIAVRWLLKAASFVILVPLSWGWTGSMKASATAAGYIPTLAAYAAWNVPTAILRHAAVLASHGAAHVSMYVARYAASTSATAMASAVSMTAWGIPMLLLASAGNTFRVLQELSAVAWGSVGRVTTRISWGLIQAGMTTAWLPWELIARSLAVALHSSGFAAAKVFNWVMATGRVLASTSGATGNLCFVCTGAVAARAMALVSSITTAAMNASVLTSTSWIAAAATCMQGCWWLVQRMLGGIVDSITSVTVTAPLWIAGMMTGAWLAGGHALASAVLSHLSGWLTCCAMWGVGAFARAVPVAASWGGRAYLVLLQALASAWVAPVRMMLASMAAAPGTLAGAATSGIGWFGTAAMTTVHAAMEGLIGYAAGLARGTVGYGGWLWLRACWWLCVNMLSVSFSFAREVYGAFWDIAASQLE